MNKESEPRIRLTRDKYIVLYPSDVLVYQKRGGGGERLIPPDKWWLNKNTPVGEPADLWESMPHEGRRLLDWNKLLAVERLAPKCN